jgi:putative ABC transport system permease protein
MNSLEPSHLPQAFILVLFAVALSYFYNLRAERDLLESSIRTTVQLLLVGYVLRSKSQKACVWFKRTV